MIICQQAQAVNNIGGSTAAPTASHYHKALIGGSALFGVSLDSPGSPDRIFSDHECSPPRVESKTKYDHKRGVEETSGISLTMNRKTNDYLDDPENEANQITTTTQPDDEQLNADEEVTMLPISPAARAAFHDPPPLSPEEIHRARLPTSPFSGPIPSTDNVSDIVEGENDRAKDLISSPALPSLIQRCSARGSPRLNLFHTKAGVKSASGGGGDLSVGDIDDRLSDFKLFGVAMEI